MRKFITYSVCHQQYLNISSVSFSFTVYMQQFHTPQSFHTFYKTHVLLILYVNIKHQVLPKLECSYGAWARGSWHHQLLSATNNRTNTTLHRHFILIKGPYITFQVDLVVWPLCHHVDVLNWWPFIKEQVKGLGIEDGVCY